MNSSKLKWFLILIFFAASVYFLFQYKTYSNELREYTDTEIEYAAKILSESTTPIKKETIPKKKTTENVLKLVFDDSKQEDIARHIMENSFASYVLPEGIAYTNDKESMIFYSDHSFEYTFSADSVSIYDSRSNGEEISLAKEKKLVKKLTSKIFKQTITDSHKISLKVLDAYAKDGKTFVTAVQQINGISIDKSELSAVFVDDSVVHIKGTLFFSERISEFSADSLDVINVLFGIDAKGVEITDIEEVYFPVTTDNGSVYLTPSYKLTFANSETHLWDATSSIQRY